MKKYILQILAVAIITLNLGTALGMATAFAAEPPAGPATTATPPPTSDYQQSTIPKPYTLPGPTAKDQRNALGSQILPKLTVFLIGSTAALSLLFLIIAGVRFATAYGNDEGVQTAKKQAIYAIVGLILALMAYTIVTIVSNFKYTE